MNWICFSFSFVAHIFIIVHQVSYASSEVTDKEYDLMPNIYLLDDYDKCLYHSLQDDPVFCRIVVQLYPENTKNASKVWNIIQEVSSNDRNYRHDLLRHAICASSYCTNDNGTLSECLKTIYSTKYKHLGLVGKLNDIQCESKNSPYEIGTADVLVIVLLGIYLMFVLLTTVGLELGKYQQRRAISEQSEKKTSPVQSFLTIFSFVDNVNSLITVKGKTKSYMIFLQTLRFACSVYVVLTHAAVSTEGVPVFNPLQVEQNTGTFFNMILSQGGLIVQTFFVISSWLIGLSFFKKLKREGKVGFVYILRSIVRRFIRFAMAEIVLVALHATWLMYLSRGPFWESIMGAEYTQCREKWWTNILLINNFGIQNGTCLLHTWYLSVDFHLTVLGLLILWLTQRKPLYLFVALGLLTAVQIVVLFVYLGLKKFEFAIIFSPELIYGGKFTTLEEWSVTWSTTYSSFAAVSVGFLFAYLQSKYQNGNVFAEKKFTILWWILMLLLVVVSPLFSSYYMTTKYYSNSRWFAATYGSINKVLFDLGIGLLIFGMAQGTGGIAKRAFEWTPMYTMGQLSFGAYLIHMSIMHIDTAQRRTLYYVSDYSTLCGTVLHVALAYLGSVIYTAVVLTPVDGLTKKLM